MYITIKLSKIKTLETFIKDFLIRKSNIEKKIRILECTDVDVCKDLLLEEYFSGMLVGLELLDFTYSIDEKQMGFGIDLSKIKKEIKNSIKITKVCNELTNQILMLFENIRNLDYKKDDFESLIKIEGKFYFLLGMIVTFNKLNIGFDVKAFLSLKNEVLNQLEGELIIDETTTNNNLITEPEIYKYINDEINLLDNGLFEILSLNKIIKNQSYEEKILDNRKNLLKKALEINPNNELQEQIEKEVESQRQCEYRVKNFDNELKNKYDIQIKEIESFIKKYIEINK